MGRWQAIKGYVAGGVNAWAEIGGNYWQDHISFWKWYCDNCTCTRMKLDPLPHTIHKNLSKVNHRSSHCGAAGLWMASLQHQDIGSTPSLALWVKESSIGSNPWSGNSICYRVAKKEKRKEKRKNGPQI